MDGPWLSTSSPGRASASGLVAGGAVLRHGVARCLGLEPRPSSRPLDLLAGAESTMRITPLNRDAFLLWELYHIVIENPQPRVVPYALRTWLGVPIRLSRPLVEHWFR